MNRDDLEKEYKRKVEVLRDLADVMEVKLEDLLYDTCKTEGCSYPVAHVGGVCAFCFLHRNHT